MIVGSTQPATCRWSRRTRASRSSSSMASCSIGDGVEPPRRAASAARGSPVSARVARHSRLVDARAGRRPARGCGPGPARPRPAARSTSCGARPRRPPRRSGPGPRPGRAAASAGRWPASGRGGRRAPTCSRCRRAPGCSPWRSGSRPRWPARRPPPGPPSQPGSSTVVERAGRVPHRGPGRLEGDEHVGAAVLHRLELPDRPTELHPHLGVLGRRRDAPVGHADRHRPGQHLGQAHRVALAATPIAGTSSQRSSGTPTPSRRTSASRLVGSKPGQRAHLDVGPVDHAPAHRSRPSPVGPAARTGRPAPRPTPRRRPTPLTAPGRVDARGRTRPRSHRRASPAARRARPAPGRRPSGRSPPRPRPSTGSARARTPGPAPRARPPARAARSPGHRAPPTPPARASPARPARPRTAGSSSAVGVERRPRRARSGRGPSTHRRTVGGQLDVVVAQPDPHQPTTPPVTHGALPVPPPTPTASLTGQVRGVAVSSWRISGQARVAGRAGSGSGGSGWRKSEAALQVAHPALIVDRQAGQALGQERPGCRARSSRRGGSRPRP